MQPSHKHNDQDSILAPLNTKYVSFAQAWDDKYTVDDMNLT